jgi:DNA-binding transcriptional LysR family regulator
MYDVHRLRLLRELSHRSTLAAVAEALGYSPSAISHQLGILERETGVTLLEPAGRGVRLTSAARTLVAHTETILRELERAEADIAASLEQVTGTVRVATFQTAAHTLILDAIDALAARHPKLTVAFAHVDAEDAIPALIARDFDLVLSEDYPGNPPQPHPGVTSTTIMTDPLILAVPTAWNAQRLTDLADMAWVMEPLGTAARTWSTNLCRAAGFEPAVRYETSDLGLHTKIVARGYAAALLPQLGHDPSPGIHLIPTGQTRTIAASTRTGSIGKPAISAVHEILARLRA